MRYLCPGPTDHTAVMLCWLLKMRAGKGSHFPYSLMRGSLNIMYQYMINYFTSSHLCIFLYSNTPSGVPTLGQSSRVQLPHSKTDIIIPSSH